MPADDFLTPTLPLAIGDENAATFRRGEHEFRLMRVNERVWAINRAHTLADVFQIELVNPSPDMRLFDAFGVRNGLPFTATASTLAWVIANFC